MALCAVRVVTTCLQMRWRDYVPVAWQVDPALALSLLDHFPSSSDVKHALELLVVEHAHAAKVAPVHNRMCSATTAQHAHSTASAVCTSFVDCSLPGDLNMPCGLCCAGSDAAQGCPAASDCTQQRKAGQDDALPAAVGTWHRYQITCCLQCSACIHTPVGPACSTPCR